MSENDITAGDPPLEQWERRLGAMSGDRFLNRAIVLLRLGRWRAGDLESAIERAERRLTTSQRDEFWAVLTRDAELAELAAEVGR
ncbi:MAG: hypothetical protein RIB67_03545 [Miltoncostaeaceae bacterium]